CAGDSQDGEPTQADTTASNHAKAVELAKRFTITDTHIDVPYRLNEEWEDISQRTAKGDFDYVRCMEGGLEVVC
ncbi:MAG: hypothetical protein KDD36_07540, partial [Flavobacteriales bacterium]|nr:hypothetical protein [Flavobacteriales bacterium]